MREIEDRPRGALPRRAALTTARTARGMGWRVTTMLAAMLGSTLAVLLVGATLAPIAGAEVCAGEPRALEILDPGDGDDSGIGGTGLERQARAAFDRAHAGQGEDDESGIGGTGHSPRAPRPQQDDESGLGGTGLHGPVTQSDRLCVNGVAITVPAQLALEGSGGVAAAHALAVGQIVFVDARRTQDGLVARRVLLADEYVGRIESVDESGRTIVIAGQRIRVPEGVPRGPGLGTASLEPGAWLAVHGLPTARDEIVATRLEVAQPNDRGRGRDESKARVDIAMWLGTVPDLDYVSLEGFVAGPPGKPRVSGLALGFAADDATSPQDARARATTGITSERERLRPGARVRVGGWLEGRETLRIAPPPRPGATTSPRRGPQLPALRPERDTPPESGPSPVPPERPTRRPEDAAPRMPMLRPDIVRPTSVRPSIDRPTRRDILPRR